MNECTYGYRYVWMDACKYVCMYVMLHIFIYLSFAVSTFVGFTNSQREICEISTYIVLHFISLFSFCSHRILAVLILNCISYLFVFTWNFYCLFYLLEYVNSKIIVPIINRIINNISFVVLVSHMFCCI